MQIRITFDTGGALTLPVNYNHIIQSIIYDALSDYPIFSEAAHNAGFSYENRKYKAFTFSGLSGHYAVKNKKITFDSRVAFEIRSPFIPFINVVGNHFADNGIDFIGQHIDNVTVDASIAELDDMAYYIKMSSPVCVYSTDPDTGWTSYYKPDDSEFYYQIAAAFDRKYRAYTGEAPPGGVSLEPVRISPRDKIVTRYKGTIIEAWKGEYLISGEPESLTFLYDTGIGSRNPEGFGMFNVIKAADYNYPL